MSQFLSGCWQFSQLQSGTLGGLLHFLLSPYCFLHTLLVTSSAAYIYAHHYRVDIPFSIHLKNGSWHSCFYISNGEIIQNQKQNTCRVFFQSFFPQYSIFSNCSNSSCSIICKSLSFCTDIALKKQ